MTNCVLIVALEHERVLIVGGVHEHAEALATDLDFLHQWYAIHRIVLDDDCTCLVVRWQKFHLSRRLIQDIIEGVAGSQLPWDACRFEILLGYINFLDFVDELDRGLSHILDLLQQAPILALHMLDKNVDAL